MGTDDIATPLLNIIVLNPQEQVIRWLIPEITDIKEINETNTVRKIEITYPVENETYEEERPWYSQGNKVFIPAIFGLTNCLYVINTEYNIDYWDKNYVTVQAEEILTELNYQVVGVYSSTKITAAKLKEWFGYYYTIGKIESLASNKNSIEKLGTVTLMTLLRTIEEKTERVFLTEYSYSNNKITRKLSLVKESTLRQNAGTEFLDLNYNLDSLDLTIDEEKTYGGMAPELSIQQQSDTSRAGYINANDSRTSDNVVNNTVSAEEIYNNWLNLEVEYRDEIPMIQEKQSDGSVVTKAKWYAPFQKQKGKLYIEHTTWSSAKYNHLQPPAPINVSNSDKIPNPIPKCGTVSTSETDAYAIYNVLANSLLDKLNPKFELNVKVADITQILGLKNLGYNIYETLYVKVPGFDYWIPAYITKTTKNPHKPGNDTITVETDVKGNHYRRTTQILMDNAIVSRTTSTGSYGGILIDEDGNPLANELVSVNIRLKEAYTNLPSTNSTLPTATNTVHQFKPIEDTYYFPENEILKLEANMRNQMGTSYVLYDIRGTAYSIPWEWALAIYYSYIQYYINSDYPLGSGLFPGSVEVHYYSDATEQLKSNNKFKYYPSYFIQYIDRRKQKDKTEGIVRTGSWDKICSAEIQSGPTCVANAIANATAYSFNYRTESQVLQLLGNQSVTTANFSDVVLPVLSKIGFEYKLVACTVANIKKYVTVGVTALVAVEVTSIGYPESDEAHEILIYDWYQNDNTFKVSIMDSNKPYMNPGAANLYNVSSPEFNGSDIVNGNILTLNNDNGKLTYRDNKNKTPYMIVIYTKKLDKTEVEPRNAEDALPNTTNGETNLHLAEYYFRPAEVKAAWKNICTLPATTDFFNRTFEIYHYSSKRTFNVNVFQVESLALQYMAHFWGQRTYALIMEDINIGTGSRHLSGAFFNALMNEQFLPGTMQLTLSDAGNVNADILTWLLFNMGYLEPPQKFGNMVALEDLGYKSIAPMTVAEWTNILKYFDSNVKTRLVDFTLNNIVTYNLCNKLVYLDKAFVESIANPTIKRSYYPAIIFDGVPGTDMPKIYIPACPATVPRYTNITGEVIEQKQDGYFHILKFSEIVLSSTVVGELKGKMLVITNVTGAGL